jgi:hypothetical protein
MCLFVCSLVWLQSWAEISDVKQSNPSLRMGNESNDKMLSEDFLRTF